MEVFGHVPGNLLIILFLLSFLPRHPSKPLTFQIPRFSPDEQNVLLEGDAVNAVGEIVLNKVNYGYRVGRVIYNGKVPLWDSNTGQLGDFATRFSFIVDTQNLSNHGSGLAFFFAPVGFQIPPNSAGGFLGLFNTTTTDSNLSRIVSVEFDSYNDSWDPSYGHVGINMNSIASLTTAPWNITLHSGELGDAWIQYNGTTKNLSVFWGYGDGPNSSLFYGIDLKEFLPQWVTMGISAATGSYVERHLLESWDFSSSLNMEENNGRNNKMIGLVVGLTLAGCVLIGVGALVAFIVVRKRRVRAMKSNVEGTNLTSMMNDDLERGAGPRRFSYGDLASATSNFSNDRKLGQGGFGGVYKGHLVDLDIPIAVKKFSGRSKQGKKQYVTEVKTISMLRHRNLVGLIGWCHDQGEFLLVYEFMPNGSLDHHLFGRKNTLSWAVRYKISLGLASALLYLHEEWEQCVVHRDIKSSNIMLDSGFNVKLGDFGLARLMDHGLGPQTTGLAGTLGYMAPEYVTTGRASKESDVYSFGVVALEIATGRKSVDPLDKDSHKGLVEWVWDLYGDGRILEAVDEKMGMDFEPRQVECLMIVGLWCAHPDRSLRPSIRQASRVLNLEADLPEIPTRMPVAMYSAPNKDPLVSSGEPLLTDSTINMGR